MSAWLPISEWLPKLEREAVRADAIAGVTTAFVLIPQGLGYALLAGLPPIAGLYAALVPPLLYALFGTSRQLAIGPVATDSLLTAVAVSAIAEAGSARYLECAIALGAMVGAVQLLLGVLGLGFVVNFLSRPVLSGFTSAVALIIGATQLKHLLGVTLPTRDVAATVVSAATSVAHWHLPTAVLSAACIALLVALRRNFPRLPRAMLGVVAATAAVAMLDLDARGIAIVGAIPAGLPSARLPLQPLPDLAALFPAAITIALVGFVEAISVGKRFARLGRYEVRPGQELVALGIANLGGACFGGYPVTSGFARTAVNAQAGARTPLAGVFTSLSVGLTLSLLTPLFFHMPHAVLAAVIVTAVLELFDAREPRRLWAVKRTDFWLLAFTFASTLGLGIQYGILAGVAASLGLFVVRSMRPHFAVLGRIPGTEAYLNVERHPHAERDPSILIVRIDGQFYFGNVSFLRETLRRLEASLRAPLRAVVLDASGVNQLDSSALDALDEVDQDYAARGVRLLMAHLKGPVRDVMCRSGMLERLGAEGRVFLRTQDAVEAASAAETGAAAETVGRRGDTADPRAAADRLGCGPAPSREEPREGVARAPARR